MDDIYIEKKDGTIEEFSIDKLITSIGKSGVPIGEATRISDEIKNWLISADINKNVTSAQIRDKVIESLLEDYPAEADSYKIYKK